MLLTNDGGIARRLELPETGWLRRYRVRMFGRPTEDDIAALAKGITVDGMKYGGIEASIDSAKGRNTWMTVALREGKNREIRKVFDQVPRRILKDQLGLKASNAHRGRQA